MAKNVVARVPVPLSQSELAALAEMARQDLHTLPEQLRHLLRLEADRRGLLAPMADPDAFLVKDLPVPAAQPMLARAVIEALIGVSGAATPDFSIKNISEITNRLLPPEHTVSPKGTGFVIRWLGFSTIRKTQRPRKGAFVVVWDELSAGLLSQRAEELGIRLPPISGGDDLISPGANTQPTP